MKREIKFKGKDEISGDWVFGCLIKGVGNRHGKYYILPNVLNLASVKNCDPLDGVEIDPETPCQLIKKIGDAEIYEYDCILRDDVIYYYYYNTNGYLYVRIIDADTLKQIYKVLSLSGDGLEYTYSKGKFIGNWHDGDEYLLNKIKEINNAN